MTTKKMVLGGGCFWCTEAIYKRVKGVARVEPGYAGGQTENPTYKQVCSGTTGHAEVIRIEYDPEAISYRELIDLFWYAHDPTTLNRQGNDIGTQYRSIIFYETNEEKEAAEKSMLQAEKEALYDDPIVTEIKPLEHFFPAEDYHNDYFANNPNQPYCRAVIAPKVSHFLKAYSREEK